MKKQLTICILFVCGFYAASANAIDAMGYYSAKRIAPDKIRAASKDSIEVIKGYWGQKFTSGRMRYVHTFFSKVGAVYNAIFVLPVMFMDDDVNQVIISPELEQLYSPEELTRFRSDVTSIAIVMAKLEDANQSEVVTALSQLNLGIVAREQLRLQ